MSTVDKKDIEINIDGELFYGNTMEISMNPDVLRIVYWYLYYISFIILLFVNINLIYQPDFLIHRSMFHQYQLI